MRLDRGSLVVLGALVYPLLEQVYFILGQVAIDAERHFDRRVGAALNQHDQGAGKTVAGFDDGPISGAFHHALVGSQVKAAFLVAFSSRLMAAQAIIINDRVDVLAETDLLFIFPQHGKGKTGQNCAPQQKFGFHDYPFQLMKVF